MGGSDDPLASFVSYAIGRLSVEFVRSHHLDLAKSVGKLSIGSRSISRFQTRLMCQWVTDSIFRIGLYLKIAYL